MKNNTFSRLGARAGFTVLELFLPILALIGLALFVAYAYWTDSSLDKLMVIVKENPAANFPWFVSIIVALIPLSLIFNIVMMFF